jgi:opacity protein-like surface antigen
MRTMSVIQSAVLTLAGLVAAVPAQADEYLWTYARGAEVLPKGEVEAVLETIIRNDKNSGSYNFWDIRPELEYGISDRLTVRGELIYFHHSYSNVEWAPLDESPSYNHTQFAGIEVGLKYNILSPFKDTIGLAVGLDYEHRTRYRIDGAAISQNSWVPGLYLQKNFLDNTLIFAFSNKVEFERRNSPGVLEEEIAFDSAIGVSYRFAPSWYAGAELRYQSDYLNPQLFDEAGTEGYDDQGYEIGYKRSSFTPSDFRLGSQYQYGTYFGPSMHYGAEKWWFTGSLLFQIKGGGSEGRNPSIINSRNWDEHERYHIGLIFGRPF